MTAALDHMAARVAADPLFLAHPLAEYAASAGLDDAGLAAALGCEVGTLTHVRLCRAPRDDAAGFRVDVEAVAARFGLDAAALAKVVVHGRGLARLRAAAPAAADAGWAVAARDRGPPAE